VWPDTAGPWAAHAPAFLLALVGVTTVAFAVPLFVTPVRWGRRMRFTIPADTDLAIYFGRCLGAVMLVIAAIATRAALTGVGLAVTFDLLVGAAGLMVVVHVWGAVRGIQPWTETVEIAFWLLLLVLTLAFHPGPTASQLVGNATTM
jgi:hypothetical protein